ncbi:hypothetical protein F7725_025736 [Dissostichus mawsoni]|uniref:Uncharacterized protein n=1 Tax=Dissostichus mawsoni TaxID=36200 RepID=A0A7J5X534_DISMA|nr:hypothetical protein F7725_025736 [Dissostichus mawsoni]
MLTLEFEVNPESSKADQMLRVRSQSVQILRPGAADLGHAVQTGGDQREDDTGLSHIIKTRKVLDMRIDLQPSFCCCLTWSSAPPPPPLWRRSWIEPTRNTTWSYDESRCSTAEQPLDFSLQLAKSMVDRDARMPRFKVSGELPLLHLKISDRNIHGLLDLVDSIPLPNMGSPASTPTEKVHLVRSVPPEVRGRFGRSLGKVWRKIGGSLEEV